MGNSATSLGSQPGSAGTVAWGLLLLASATGLFIGRRRPVIEDR
jgi:hypothetical protein